MESLKGKHEFVYHAHPITDGIPVCMLELKVIEEINSNSLKLTKLWFYFNILLIITSLDHRHMQQSPPPVISLFFLVISLTPSS